MKTRKPGAIRIPQAVRSPGGVMDLTEVLRDAMMARALHDALNDTMPEPSASSSPRPPEDQDSKARRP